MTEINSSIFFHEDDYCQQELLPLAALEFCRQQISEIDEFSAAHGAPDGVGWTDMYIQGESPQKLVDFQITREAFRESMLPRLPEIPAVYSGYSSHSSVCSNTIAYGHAHDCVVFSDWNNDGVLEHVWASIFTTDDAHLDDVVGSLQRMGAQFPLLYVDWAWSFATPLDQSNALRDRLKSKALEVQRRIKGSN